MCVNVYVNVYVCVCERVCVHVYWMRFRKKGVLRERRNELDTRGLVELGRPIQAGEYTK